MVRLLKASRTFFSLYENWMAACGGTTGYPPWVKGFLVYAQITPPLRSGLSFHWSNAELYRRIHAPFSHLSARRRNKWTASLDVCQRIPEIVDTTASPAIVS
jgi:hypothetical protein